MIRAVTASHASFHPVSFEPGLNLVLADVTPASGDKDTRNGVGKTSLLEIIHFCLGSSLRKGDTLKVPELADWTFSLTFDLGEQVVTATRAIGAARITMVGGDGPRTFSLGEWTDLLGRELFDLPSSEADESVHPSFRSLISYVARRARFAYDHPFDHHPRTATWDRQVNMAYLLGLGWRDAAAFERVRRKKKWLADQQAASKAGVAETQPRQRGRLEADRVRFEEAVHLLEGELATFHVHPEYSKIEDEANALTRELQALANENLSDKNLLSYYREAVASESAPDEHSIVELFEAAQVELPGAMRQELESLRVFHASVVANRRAFLAAEVSGIEARLAEREHRARELTEQRASRFAILQSHGALDEYTRLQSRLGERKEQLGRVLSQLAAIDRLEHEGRALRVEAQAVYDRAKLAHDERHLQRERAISLFNGYSEDLYAEPGNLILDVRQGRQSPVLDLGVEILRSKATGIEHMTTLCLDLTIAALWSERPKRPGFLIHDSTLFEGVDERQRTLALDLVRRETSARGYQYILALNTDELPRQLPHGFDPKQYERLRLTDEPSEASLFGIRF